MNKWDLFFTFHDKNKEQNVLHATNNLNFLAHKNARYISFYLFIDNILVSYINENDKKNCIFS